MPKRGSLKNMKVLRMGFGREDMQNKKRNYGKQKKKLWKTKKKLWKTKKETLFLKGFPFCEVSSGVEPLYTVLQTVT